MPFGNQSSEMGRKQATPRTARRRGKPRLRDLEAAGARKVRFRRLFPTREGAIEFPRRIGLKPDTTYNRTDCRPIARNADTTYDLMDCGHDATIATYKIGLMTADC